jgi:Holliday junction resolvase RusA-like endonuclease
MQVLNIDPVSAPRMTQSDRWKKRPCVLRYFDFKEKVKASGIKVNECGDHVTFVIPMPKSWSKKKKGMMNRKPHQQKPDVDNLLKALLDAIFKDDCKIWDIKATKIWGYEGSIIIKNEYDN